MRTDDLFLGAFALARGGDLVTIDVEETNGRRVAVFVIAGPGVDDAERDYFRGATSVDVQHLKSQVRRLKEHAFSALRADASRPQAAPAASRRSERSPRRSW